MATFKKLEEIIAWQKARELCKEIRKDADAYIKAKEFELLNQIKSSSGSCMDNIAEGFGRMGNNEFRNFLTIAHGSIMEVVSQLYRTYDYEIISEERFKFLLEKTYEVQRLLHSLITHLTQTPMKGVKFQKPVVLNPGTE